jgi:hypothetical protein
MMMVRSGEDRDLADIASIDAAALRRRAST